MDGEATTSYHLLADDNDEDFFIEYRMENDSYIAAQTENDASCKFFFSLIQFISTSFKLSVVCGILTCLLATLLWWFEMNVRGYCNENWDNIPIGIRRLRLFVDSFEAVFIMMWLLLIVATIS